MINVSLTQDGQEKGNLILFADRENLLPEGITPKMVGENIQMALSGLLPYSVETKLEGQLHEVEPVAPEGVEAPTPAESPQVAPTEEEAEQAPEPTGKSVVEPRKGIKVMCTHEEVSGLKKAISGLIKGNKSSADIWSEGLEEGSQVLVAFPAQGQKGDFEGIAYAKLPHDTWVNATVALAKKNPADEPKALLLS